MATFLRTLLPKSKSEVHPDVPDVHQEKVFTMDQLAPDQTVEDLEALLSGLAANAASLTYKELQTKLAQNAEALRTLHQRRLASFDAIDAAKADLQKQEAAFLIESPTYNPGNLRQWTEALEKAQAKATHLRNQEARLTALAGVLSAELQKRDSRRTYLISTKLREKHASNLEETLNIARAAVAKAICASAWSVSGLAPTDVLPTLFFQNCLLEGSIRDHVESLAAAERQQADAEVKADKMLGDQ